MSNEKIRKTIFTANVKYWEIARELGIHEVTFSRRLRDELSPEEQEKVLQAIERVKAAKA